MPPQLLDDRQRRLSEFLMPASVILAGVLIVVAFGFVISGAVRKNEPSAIPPVQPPALGDVPLNPDNQFPIPLPSASDLPSPTDTPTTTPPTTPPTTRSKVPPPDQGTVKVARQDVPSRVDLSAEGTRDWVHWGEQSTFSLERRSDGDFAILEGPPTAPRFRHGFSRQLFSWRGGSPVDSSDGTPTGVRTCGKGNGYTISAPATTSNRTLKLYVGALAGRGKLTARLSTGNASATGTFEARGNGLDTAVFVITYRAPKNGKLNLTWTTEAAFNDDCGGVSLEAATLR
ncbi:hypothetical protein ACFQFC_00020 [Amorphoplanes digitatis]|uniref:Uncharacterized protein n=1 Tax=Actinoplanes digitatis TaxID=1868 RepID=A0A7W7MQG6_9ACTN|nr:hypothetical protein [Actinoplanes digitatis]MBB4762560.1 hypothetical protein [Actinoplanes digitatis]GID91941.1 hypothetical protein Adi01nite_13530 [Actinoplanes digitatis]